MKHDGGFWNRLAALLRKEFNQLRRDRRLAVSLIVPPTVQIILFGFALNADVSNLRLGIIDESRTPESRELIASFTESRSFLAGGMFLDQSDLEAAISRNRLDAGLVIPYDFTDRIRRRTPVDVQLFLNAVNANTASIGYGYAQGILQNYNQQFDSGGVRLAMVSRTAFLYNPGLVASWFIVTGTFGVLLILNGSLVASTAMIKEREAGTVEQLLMTPAGTTEIILSKIIPLFLMMLVMVLVAMTLMRLVFDVPSRGNLWLVVSAAALCVLCGIAIGTVVATFTRSAQQAQLIAFFINPPLATLSGSLTPVEAMPQWLQPATVINPIRHFGVITRATLLKGAGMDTLWPNFLALVAFTLILVTLSVWRFRKQLG
jgi:ABC-2 type transport system permease protein